ncbi:MAG: hypothetical protein K9L17_09790 [Clostridiales bacterium]|nr:hypothetical protein [Clostridiales bacterium]MCF8022971.1 hypothetical protein [Clostridiales bacterium]
MLGRISNAAALGSIFPDTIVSSEVTHKKAHSAGNILIQNNCVFPENMRDFTLGAVTHGNSPPGLDYYGDEHYPGCERGYCFEIGRDFIESTIRACNIPEHMGWWKSHNIVEMGVELYVSSRGPYGEIIREACSNDELINYLAQVLPNELCPDTSFLKSRIKRFPYYIEVHNVTPKNLAHKYKIQTYSKHGIIIIPEEVARLISAAAEIISNDIEEFFDFVEQKMQPHLQPLMQ